MTDAVVRLRDALAAYAKGGVSPHDWTPEACAALFESAGIAIPDERKEAVEHVFRQTPFRGGNFKQDAKRLLNAAKVQP